MFEKRVEQIFGDLPNVAMDFDELIVAGRTKAEHDKNLRMLLERARMANAKFNRQKVCVQLNLKEVRFFEANHLCGRRET